MGRQIPLQVPHRGENPGTRTPTGRNVPEDAGVVWTKIHVVSATLLVRDASMWWHALTLSDTSCTQHDGMPC
eukprot:m.67669 g.67669  ORF g.67669 m.67669 type:complete len:72 (+) comp15972_c0_seq21:843-1058(+)